MSIYSTITSCLFIVPLHHVYLLYTYLSEYGVAFRQLGRTAGSDREVGNALPEALAHGQHLGVGLEVAGKVLQRPLPERVRHQTAPTQPKTNHERGTIKSCQHF